jgi:type 1 glutamine amidotransferase
MMMRRTLLAALAVILPVVAVPSGASARPVVDCPLAHAPYSLDTPLFDLLIDARARAVLEDAGILGKLPPALARATTPSFATIISLRTIGGWNVLPSETLQTVEQRLAGLPLRKQDIEARCARYEPSASRPLAVSAAKPAVLVFEKSNGFRDGPSVDAATAALRDIGERRGWDMVFTHSSAQFTRANLKQFAAVVWNNVSGDALTMAQRKAFRSYIEQGGGFAGFHGSGGDPVYWWDWYADDLVGARFIGHPDKHQVGRLATEGDSAITRGIAGEWSLLEEWYSFARSPRLSGARILVTLDEASYNPNDGRQNLRMGADHPVAWTRCVRKGRSFYSAIGHRPEVYRDPRNLALMEQGIEWAMDGRGSDCAPGRRAAGRR